MESVILYYSHLEIKLWYLVNRCLTDPCGPGVCIESGNGEEYSCACPDGYSGEQCEEFEFGDAQLFADDSGFSDLINNRQDQSWGYK